MVARAIIDVHPDVGVRVTAYRQLQALYRMLDDAALQLTALRHGQPLCVEGCGLCCLRNTPVATQLEAEYLWSNLLALPEGERQAVLADCWNWLIEHRPEVRQYGPPGPVLDGEARRQLAEEGQRIQESRCPFLSEERRCRVHAFRPLACRAYSVTLAPDEYCQRPLASLETEWTRMSAGGAGLVEGLKRQVGQLKSYLQQKHPNGLLSGFLPLRLLCCVDPGRVRQHVEQGEVATAKLGFRTGKLPWRFFRDQTTLDISES